MQLATHRLPGLVLTDHQWQVPLDHGSPDGERILVYGREVVATKKASDDLPWLVFLQGGPGFAAPRPESRSGWLQLVLETHRVLLLDQRGTGRSTPVGHQSLARLDGAAAQAAYLSCFRADSIVDDCELIRRDLLGESGKWKILGQSFGGFCAVTYLSRAPQGLAAALITGGLPPLTATAEEVYRATYARVLERNRRYHERYPQDAGILADVVDHIERGDALLSDGEPLSVRRLQQLGMGLGFSYGAPRLHYLLEQAFIEGRAGPELSYTFLEGVAAQLPFETNPIYAILHEPIYNQGAASRWAAERVRSEFPDLQPAAGKPLNFTGEMVYPWMFEEYRHLRPLADAAHLLAEKDDWPALYDPEVLRANEVPCAAVIYSDDLYVERSLSEETAATIRGAKAWLTSEHQHDGLRSAGKDVVGKLLDLVNGEADCPP